MNISRTFSAASTGLETKNPCGHSGEDELGEDLGELFFMIVDGKVHMNRFLAALDDAIQTVRNAGDENTKAMCAMFPEAHKKLPAIVPSVPALDAQATDREL